MSSPRTIAIGDIHGCHLALETLLRLIEPRPDDTLVTLGDYVDRGPQSRAVIESLLELERSGRLVPLRGNHEQMMLAARDNSLEAAFWIRFGGRETLASYGGRINLIPEEHFAFLERCRSGHETDTHLFLHANYDPALSLDDQPEVLRYWTHLHPFELPPPHRSGKTVVVGHTPQQGNEVLDGGHVVCIDTCCFGAGCLTALDVDARVIWQVDKQGRVLAEQQPL